MRQPSPVFPNGVSSAPACATPLNPPTAHPVLWRSRRGGERGVARPEVLQQLLGTCERVVQEVDSVEYGLTDIQVRRAAGAAAGRK